MELLFVTEENAELLRVEGQQTSLAAQGPAAVEFFASEQYACIQVGSQRLRLSKESMLTRTNERTWLFPADHGIVFAVVFSSATPSEDLEMFHSLVSHFTAVLTPEQVAQAEQQQRSHVVAFPASKATTTTNTTSTLPTTHTSASAPVVALPASGSSQTANSASAVSPTATAVAVPSTPTATAVPATPTATAVAVPFTPTATALAVPGTHVTAANTGAPDVPDSGVIIHTADSSSASYPALTSDEVTASTTLPTTTSTSSTSTAESSSSTTSVTSSVASFFSSLFSSSTSATTTSSTSVSSTSSAPSSRRASTSSNPRSSTSSNSRSSTSSNSRSSTSSGSSSARDSSSSTTATTASMPSSSTANTNTQLTTTSTPLSSENALIESNSISHLSQSASKPPSKVAGTIEKAGSVVAKGIVYSADTAGSGLRTAGAWVAHQVGPKESKEVSDATKKRLSGVRNVTSTGLEVSRGLLSASVSMFKMVGNKAAERVRNSNAYQSRAKPGAPPSATAEIGAAVITAGVDVYHSLRTAAIVLATHTEGAAVETATKIYGEEYGQHVVKPIAGGVMDVGLSVVNLAALATSKVAVAGEVSVEAIDHLASKASWAQGDILFQGWIKERGTVNIMSWRPVWATLRSAALHIAASPEHAARSRSHAADLAQHLEKLPQAQLEVLSNNVNQQLSSQMAASDDEDVKMMGAVREYMRKEFINTVIRFKRENETAGFEDFLSNSFPENVILAPDGTVESIDQRVLNDEWKGTYEAVHKDDPLFPLAGLPGIEEEQKVQPSGLSKTWLQLHQFVAEAIHAKDAVVPVGSSAVVESKASASSSFLQTMRDGTNSAIASVNQSLSELKEKWIPIEDIQDVESTSGSIQGDAQALETRFRIHTRDGMVHYFETETPALSAQFQALLLQCMATTRRTQLLTGGHTHSGLRALRLLRNPAPANALALPNSANSQHNTA